MFKKISLICLIVIISAFIVSEPVMAYTGIFGVFPPIENGPSSITVHEFTFDTTGGLPASITTNLFYLQSVIIETSPGMVGSFIVKEYPAGNSQRFDIIVSDEVQGALINATLFVWANVEAEEEPAKITICHKGEQGTAPKKTMAVPPSALQSHLNHGDSMGVCEGDEPEEEDDSIIVAHDHEGEPTIYETAYQVSPAIEGSDGTSLWYFSVNQFSSFTIFDALTNPITFNNNPWSSPNVLVFMIGLLMVSIVAPVALRQN